MLIEVVVIEQVTKRFKTEIPDGTPKEALVEEALKTENDWQILDGEDSDGGDITMIIDDQNGNKLWEQGE